MVCSFQVGELVICNPPQLVFNSCETMKFIHWGLKYGRLKLKNFSAVNINVFQKRDSFNWALGHFIKNEWNEIETNHGNKCCMRCWRTIYHNSLHEIKILKDNFIQIQIRVRSLHWDGRVAHGSTRYEWILFITKYKADDDVWVEWLNNNDVLPSMNTCHDYTPASTSAIISDDQFRWLIDCNP